MADNTQPNWTKLDVSDLRDGFPENLSASDIVDQLLRTEADVAEKALELGIKLRTK